MKNIGFLSIIGVLFFMFSCATVHQELDPKIYYKRDMKIYHKKKKRIGTFVLPQRSEYNLTFKSHGKLDLFTFTTCHREITQEHASSKGIFSNKKKFSLKYRPQKDIEALYSCAIKVAGFDIKGKHSFAFLDIETPDAKLPALIKCNGSAYNSNGVTVCQSREGLEQSIEFPGEVVFMPEKATRKECKEIIYKIQEKKKIIYNTPNRECTYIFIEVKEPHREHRLNTIGYEQILIREL